MKTRPTFVTQNRYEFFSGVRYAATALRHKIGQLGIPHDLASCKIDLV